MWIFYLSYLILVSVLTLAKSSNYLLIKVSNETSVSRKDGTEDNDYLSIINQNQIRDLLPEWARPKPWLKATCKDKSGNIRGKDEKWSIKKDCCNTCSCRCLVLGYDSIFGSGYKTKYNCDDCTKKICIFGCGPPMIIGY